MSSSSSISSSLLPERKVDVFLSFCNNNIGHELFQVYLFQNGIKTFESNSWEETRVRPIDQRTLEALEESKVAVVMISPREPFSIGFLEELIVILEFQEKGSLTVIPIFLTPYPLDDVEEEICQRYPENAPSWRTALTKLAIIAAEYPFSQNLRCTGLSDWLKKIAHDICLLFLSSMSTDLNGLVAMDRHMEVIYEMLAFNKEVRTIGIWGSAGVGKTTLARYIYAEISVNFQTHVFLENVENMKDKILKFQGEEDPTVVRSLDHDWHEVTEARRKHRKVLLIADDVNSIEQGKWIITYAKWFAPGSRVILISQNKNLLVDAGAMDVYEVRSLRYDEALQLFSHFAFKQPYPPSDFEQLAVRAVHLAGFLPLALRLLGSFLTGRGREEWLAALLKLKAKHGENIMEVWKLMEASEDKCQEEWEATTDIVKGMKSSQDKGQEVEKKHIQTTIGLEAMVEKAWKSLMNAERRTLGLYGMGGVGKTTLLALINNKFVDEFDVVIWVVVSKNLQNERIQNQMLGRLRLDKEWKGEIEEEKVSSINKILSRKKFVLLLDDLWSEVDLNKIGVPLPTRDNGSKIVFTTRSKEVCKNMKADDEMKVDCLPPDEAWELFRSIVGEFALNRHQDIPTLARKVAEKCCGLPLALNVIGKAMACNEDVDEWRQAIDVLNSSSHEFPGMEENILSSLKFSYDGLEDENVKSCFLYCSLFPEDYEIMKEELIEYWIGEGFINGKRDEDGSNNQGHAIIGSLVRAQLLVDVEAEFPAMVKMHNVLRQMAIWIGSNFGKPEEKLCVKSGVQLRRIPNDINWNVKRISLMSNKIGEISCCPECPNLSTLLLRDNRLKVIPGEFFQFMKALVVLDLSKNPALCALPEEICSLSSLEYLNLSSTRIKSLPAGWKGLRKLISLDLENTCSLESIDGIGTSLPNLQVLKLFCSRLCIDATLMEELQLLEHLQILTATIKDASILESIQGVERLANSIRRLNLVGMSAEVVVLNTVALGGLQRLGIENCKISEIKIDWESKEREELLCTSSQGFKHLSIVSIVELEGSQDLTWLLFAQNLRVLSVWHSPSIEEIINREKGMSISNVHPDISVPFGKLESLQLGLLPELKRICSNSLVLPNLRKFVVDKCPKLPKAATEFPETRAAIIDGED